MTFDKRSAFGEEARRQEGYKRQISIDPENHKRAVAEYLNKQEEESKTKTSGKRALARLDEIIEDLRTYENEDYHDPQFLSDELEEVRHALTRSLND